MFTADDIRKKTFTKGFRGYDSQEVDAFIAEVAKEFDYLYLDNLSLKETVERLSSKWRAPCTAPSPWLRKRRKR